MPTSRSIVAGRNSSEIGVHCYMVKVESNVSLNEPAIVDVLPGCNANLINVKGCQLLAFSEPLWRPVQARCDPRLLGLRKQTLRKKPPQCEGSHTSPPTKMLRVGLLATKAARNDLVSAVACSPDPGVITLAGVPFGYTALSQADATAAQV
jgi:hypothetical protein